MGAANDDLTRLPRHDELLAHLELALEGTEHLDDSVREQVRGELKRAKSKAETSRHKAEARVRASAAANERLERERTR
jgi:hypothetical protein